MAVCEYCDQEMNDADSCTLREVELDGVVYERDSSYFDNGERCHDCGILNRPGHYHHLGCDMERCPKCGEQFIGCDCVDDGEDD